MSINGSLEITAVKLRGEMSGMVALKVRSRTLERGGKTAEERKP